MRTIVIDLLLRVALFSAAVSFQPGTVLAQNSAPSTFQFVVQTRHTHGVSAIALSPDGKLFATAGSHGGGNSIHLRDIQTQTLLRIMSGHDEQVFSLAFSHDGKTLWSAGRDSVLQKWDITTGRSIQKLPIQPEDGGVRSMDLLPDGRRLAVTTKSSVQIWDIDSSRLLQKIDPLRNKYARNPPGEVVAMKLAADGQSVVIVSRQTEIEYKRVDETTAVKEEIALWSIDSGQMIRKFDTSKLKRTVTTRALNLVLAFAADGQTLAVGSLSSGEVTIYSASSGRPIRTFGAASGYVNKLEFLPDSSRLLIASSDRGISSIKNLNVTTGTSLDLDLPPNEYVNAISLSANGKLLIAGGRDIYIIRVQPGVVDAKLVASDADTSGTLPPKVIFSGDSKQLVWSGRESLFTKWDAVNGMLLFAKPAVPESNSVAFIDTEKVFVATSKCCYGLDYTIEERDTETNSVGREIRGKGVIHQFAVSRDGSLLWANPIDSFQQSFIFWNPKAGGEPRMVPAEWMLDLSIAPNGQRGLSVSRKSNEITEWDLASGRQLRTLGRQSGTQVVLHAPDGRSAASSGANGIQLWDLATGRVTRSMSDHRSAVRTLAYSSSGRFLASGSGDNTGFVHDVVTGRVVASLRGNPQGIVSLTFSADDRRIVTASDDNSFRLWEASSGALVATFYARGDGEWIVITPEGFFNASESGAKILTLVNGSDPYSIDQFYQALYRPDLVREKLAGDQRGLVREAARLDLNRILTSGRVPAVAILSPASGPALGQEIGVEAEFTDLGGGIGRIEWRVNGMTVGIETPPASTAGQPLRLTRSVALEAGSNMVELVAYNSANLVASLPARIAVTAPASLDRTGPLAKPQQSRLFVLAAGINEYADNRFKLAGSVRDAQALSKAFATNSDGLYKSVEVKLLTDADVNQEKLDASFAEFAARATTSDVFLLYLAGHGKTVDGRYYFVPRDFKVGDNSDEKAVNAAVVEQGIAQEQWQRWFASIPARKSMILFDTCESGTLTGVTSQTKSLEQSAANDRLAQATGRSIITASSGTQVAFEGYRGHGLFTYNLLDALDRADSDGNGTIEINELAAYVYAQVTTLSEKIFKKRQEPQIRIASSYPLAKQGRVLAGDFNAVAQDNTPTFQLAQKADLQIKPSNGATVVRSLNAKTKVTVIKSEGGWSLVASGGKPLGYVATRDLAPAQ